MKTYYYFISFLLFFTLSLSVSAQKQNYFTIIINNNDNDLGKLGSIIKTAENKGRKYKRVFIEQYALIKNSRGHKSTFLFDKPQKFKSSKYKKSKLKSNAEHFDGEYCDAVASGAMNNIFIQLFSRIKKDSDRFGFEKNTEIIIFDASNSIRVADEFTIFSNLGDLKLYLKDLMNDKSKIILIYNSFEEKDLEIRITEPHYDNNDFFIPACLTKDADFKDYYYPFKWTLPDLCGMSTTITFYDKKENVIFKSKFDEKKNIKGEDYYWQKNGNNYCFFLKANKLWDIMKRAYNVPSTIDLWNNPDAYVSFEINAKNFDVEALGERVRFFINCHLEIYENTNCDCK